MRLHELTTPDELDTLFEMTWKADSLEVLGAEGYDAVTEYGKKEGTLLGYQVWAYDEVGEHYWRVMDGADEVGKFSGTLHADGFEFRTAYINPVYRRKGLLSAFFTYLKKHGFPSFRLSDIHSTGTAEALKRLATDHDMFWVKGSEKVEYDPRTTGRFYGTSGKTGWVLVVEAQKPPRR